MKRSGLSYASAKLPILTAMLCMSQAVNATKEVTVGFNNEASFPYFRENGTEHGRYPGTSLDILNVCQKKLGVKFSYRRMPGKRVLTSLKEGLIDAAFIFSYKKEREQYGVYPMQGSKPNGEFRMAALSYVLYKTIGSELDWNGQGFRNLQGQIGANLNYSIVKDLKKQGVDTLEIKRTDKLLKLLVRGRVDGVVLQEDTADSILRKNKMFYIEKDSPPVKTKNYYLIFNPRFFRDSEDLSRKIWDCIRDNRDDVVAERMQYYID